MDLNLEHFHATIFNLMERSIAVFGVIKYNFKNLKMNVVVSAMVFVKILIQLLLFLKHRCRARNDKNRSA